MNLEKENYDKFLKLLVREFSEKYPNVCLFGYGSLFNSNGRFNPGISDIDGGIILDSGVITPKNEILKISRAYSRALRKSGLVKLRNRPDFNLMDRCTNQDGRFLSYRKTYIEHIKKFGMVLSGPNYLGEMSELEDREESLIDAAFVFRSLRNKVLNCYDILSCDSERFSEFVVGSMNKVSKFPKKLLEIVDANTIEIDRLKSQNKLEEVLETEFPMLSFINQLVLKPSKKIYKFLSDREKAIHSLGYSLETVEIIVNAFLKKFLR